jgi:ubiquinone/menaquinone biosynthesis C-methylase UbiE
MFACPGADLSDVELTDRAVELTVPGVRPGLGSDLRVGDAESLPFEDNTFDHVYSWGVIDHSPNTPKGAQEVLRVLKLKPQALSRSRPVTGPA